MDSHRLRFWIFLKTFRVTLFKLNIVRQTMSFLGKHELFLMHENIKRCIIFYFQLQLDKAQQNEKLMTHILY